MMTRPVIYAGAAVAGALLFYVLIKKQPGETIAAAAGRVAAGAVVNAGVGAVKGVGAAVGVPDTSTDQCTADLAAGRTWAASFSCPAGRFIGNVFNSTKITESETRDGALVDQQIEERQALAFNFGIIDPATGWE